MINQYHIGNHMKNTNTTSAKVNNNTLQIQEVAALNPCNRDFDRKLWDLGKKFGVRLNFDTFTSSLADELSKQKASHLYHFILRLIGLARRFNKRKFFHSDKELLSKESMSHSLNVSVATLKRHRARAKELGLITTKNIVKNKTEYKINTKWFEPIIATMLESQGVKIESGSQQYHDDTSHIIDHDNVLRTYNNAEKKVRKIGNQHKLRSRRAGQRCFTHKKHHTQQEKITFDKLLSIGIFERIAIATLLEMDAAYLLELCNHAIQECGSNARYYVLGCIKKAIPNITNKQVRDDIILAAKVNNGYHQKQQRQAAVQTTEESATVQTMTREVFEQTAAIRPSMRARLEKQIQKGTLKLVS